MRKICCVIVDRANYGRLFPLLKYLNAQDNVDLSIICTGTTILERFGRVADEIENAGFNVIAKINCEIEGSNVLSMTQSIGLGVINISPALDFHKPDLVLIIGDRYEALSAAISSACQNIPLAHLQGGEVSGSIDESIRHAITKLAHLHFPATDRAEQYIINMGENPKHVFNFGCPSADYIHAIDVDTITNEINSIGVGAQIDIAKPYFVCLVHPVTTDPISQRERVKILLSALDFFQIQTVLLWPNIDAGSEAVSKEIRAHRENTNVHYIRYVKHLDHQHFQKLLKFSAIAIGNSSSFIRDSSFSGTPVVLIGNRQIGREHGHNVLNVNFSQEEIISAIKHQISHGRYPPNAIYGSPGASKLIGDKLVECELMINKYLNYT